MATEIGFNSNLRCGSHRLRVQTGYDEGNRRVHASIFEGVNLVDTRELIFEEPPPAEMLEPEVRQFHDLVVSDLELLFHVLRKVKDAKNPDSISKLGSLFLEKGFHKEAIDTFQTLAKIAPGRADLDLHLGRALFKSGDYENAQKHLLAASEKTPNYPDVHVMLAEVFRKTQEYIKATEVLKKAISLNPDYLRAHILFGLLLAESTVQLPVHPDLPPPIERMKESKQHLQYALTLSHEPQKNHLDVGLELLESRERFEEGVAEIDKAIDSAMTNHKSLVADSEFYLKFLFADFEHSNRTLDNYIKTLEKTAAQHPDYADIRQSLGTAYLLRGWHNFARAIEAYREAININPQYQKAQKNMRLLENEGRGILLLLRAVLK